MKKYKIIIGILVIIAMLVGLFPHSMNNEDNQTDLVSSQSENDGTNIQVHLFDYKTGNTEVVSPSKNYNTGINKNHEFKFLSDAGNLKTNHMNKWTGSHGFPRTQIVEDRLENGYPKLVGGESLSYLFDASKQDGKTAYMNVGGLFQTDENGYTYFNSNDNYAEYNGETNSFELKDIILRKGKAFPCFYPFDKYDSAYKKAQGTNGVDTSLNSFTANNANHYFGMMVSTEFYTLEGGKIHGEDMVFDFSGDDDVWVFIDDVLVLDIGGIHTTVSGSINFNTGDVFIANDIGERKTQENIYKSAKIFNSDYAKHSLKVFYLERGNSASNCNISFNMPTIPNESVVLTKKVVDKSGKLMDENLLIDFKFLVKKNDEPLANTEFVLMTENGTKTEKTDDNGCLYMKNGYTAMLPNFSATDTFEITEVDYALNGYNVTLNGQEIVVMNKSDGIGTVIPSASSGKLLVKDTQNVVFNNIVEKLTDLCITKDIEEDNCNIINEEFNVKLELNGKPYIGEYTINDKKFETNNGEFVIKNQETIKIDELPYGTSFEVSEPKNNSYTQNYTFSSNVYDINEKDDGAETTVYGRIGGSSEVISINKEIPDKNSKTLTVSKEWVNDVKKNRPSSITFDLYKNGKPFITNIELSEKNGWSYTFNNLFVFSNNVENVYSVVETKIGSEKVVNNTAMGYYSEIFNDNGNIIIRNSYGGDIVIKKVIDDKVDKNPIFIFKITDRFDNVYYEFMKFSKEDTEKSITIHNIAIGNCIIEEVDVFRYEAIGNSKIQINVTKDSQMVKFENGLVSSKYYSDTDCVKNHFVVGEGMVKSE